MNRECQRLMETMLAGGAADDGELRAHLEGCAACRHLLVTWRALREVPVPVVRTQPPEHVDLAIRREAMVFVEERSRRHHALVRWVGWAAAAACVALVAGMALSLLKEPAPASGQSAASTAWAPPVAAPAWRQLGLREDCFELNAELEITFAMLSMPTPRPQGTAVPLPRPAKPSPGGLAI